MEHIHRGTGGEAVRRDDTFTGAVYSDRAMSGDGVGVTNVLFTPGGRTYWHSHSGGQLLSGTHGRGLVASRSGDAVLLEGSDLVWAPPNEEHWHGATPKSLLLHRAVSLGVTTWLEEVSDADYQAAVGKVPNASA